MDKKFVAIGLLKGTDIIARFEQYCYEHEINGLVKMAENKFGKIIKIVVYSYNSYGGHWVLDRRIA